MKRWWIKLNKGLMERFRLGWDLAGLGFACWVCGVRRWKSFLASKLNSWDFPCHRGGVGLGLGFEFGFDPCDSWLGN